MATSKMDEVISSLRDFEVHLNNVRKRLEKQHYSFRFSIISEKLRLFVPLNLEGKINSACLFYDADGKRPIGARSYDEKRHVLFVHKLPGGTRSIYLRMGEETHSIRVDRLIELGDIAPDVHEEDRQREALDFIFKRSKEVFSPDNVHRSYARIISSDSERKGTITIDEVPNTEILIVKADVHSVRRQMEAIKMLALRPQPHHVPLLRLLLHARENDWGEMQNIAIGTPEWIKTSYSGSEQQVDFVQKALATPDFAILEGPPGSGKTATLIELVIQLVKQGKRVLLVASTHVAVDNILERISEGEDGQRLMDRFGIVPLRIGREEAVSERVSQFRIERRADEEIRQMVESMARLKKMSPAQEKLFHAIQDPETNKETMTDLVLSVANLVCGTTIGILQTPLIKESSAPFPLFDVMILDEASKTTFQEFIVPALYASKWIISGDPKQLAPYVDENNIIEGLRSYCEEIDLDYEARWVCAEVADAFSRGRMEFRPGEMHCRVMVVDDGSSTIALYRKQIAKLNELLMQPSMVGPSEVPAVVIDGTVEDEKWREVTASRLVVVVSSMFEEIEPYLPPYSQIEGHNVRMERGFRARMVAAEKGFDPYKGKRKGQSWEEQVVWRICRMYEVRDQPRKYQRYEEELELLLPWCVEDHRVFGKIPIIDHILYHISMVRRVSLPSVVDLLMFGFESEKKAKMQEVALYNGLPPSVLGPRHTLLTYQHRMHPDISRFPRAEIYGMEGALKDGCRVLENRAWSFRRYNQRSVIIDIRPRHEDISVQGYGDNHNLSEAERMMSELGEILKWTARNPKPEGIDGGKWSIALLTFYLDQERLLKDTIRRRFGVHGSHFFDMTAKNAEIEICDVDRFQGHEADIVLLSFVRSIEHHKGIGFLDNRNRLNVAITRAKYQLVVFMDRRMFEHGGTELLRKFESMTNGPIDYWSRGASE